MKVVHLLPALEQGGVETVVVGLADALGRAGVETVVVSKGGRLVAAVEAAGASHVALDLKSKNPLTYFFRAWRLRRVLAAEQPDLVCVHSRVPAWLFVWANRTLRLPWISYAHGANSVSRYSEVMTKGDRVIVPSSFLADYLKAHYPVTDETIRVVPNAVDTARFDPARIDSAAVEALRREWGLDAADRVLMAVGRITPVKGLDSLVRDFAAEAARTPNLKLVIVGGADRRHVGYLDELRRLAASLGIAGRVVFAGSRADVPECLAVADEVVSANTTKPETFGLSVVEAYAMNKPVRAKRFGGVGEVMAAVEAMHAPTLREAVTALYGPEVQAERTLSVYREVLKMI